MQLNRTTTRALAASVALVAAGGTLAGAAVFHIPVLGFGAANAGATARQIERVASVDTTAKRVAPIRVVKTRFIDQFVHHRAAAAAAAPAAPAAPAHVRAATRSASHMDEPPSSTMPPSLDPPSSPPTSGGDDGFEGGSDDGSEHGGHGDQSGGGTQAGG